MTIREAVRTGRLPSNVGLQFLLHVCKSLSIPANDFDYDLTLEQLKRLQFSPAVHKKSVDIEVRNAHDVLSNKYQRLINRYENLSYRMGESGYLDDSKKEVDKILSELKKAKDGYDNVIANIAIDEQNLGFDSNVLNPVDSIVMNASGRGLQKNGAKLSSEYEKLEGLRSKDYKTKFKKSINEKRINRVCAKIRRLQNKQGKMQTTQKKIVNKGSAKYAKRKAREMEKYFADFDRYRVYSDMKASLKESRENYEHDINQTKTELEALRNKVGIVNGARKIKNNVELAVMEANLKKFRMQEKAVERLRTKQGRCKLGEQYYRTIARSLAA